MPSCPKCRRKIPVTSIIFCVRKFYRCPNCKSDLKIQEMGVGTLGGVVIAIIIILYFMLIIYSYIKHPFTWHPFGHLLNDYIGLEGVCLLDIIILSLLCYLLWGYAGFRVVNEGDRAGFAGGANDLILMKGRIVIGGIGLIVAGFITAAFEVFHLIFSILIILFGFFLLSLGIHYLGGIKIPGENYKVLDMPEGDYEPVLTSRHARGGVGVISHHPGKEADGVLHCKGCGMPYVFDEDNLTCNKCGGVLGDGADSKEEKG
jgi:hypothetical protein